MDANDRADLEWVVWNLEVRDAHSRTPAGIGERTTPVMSDMAGSLGCVFIQCCDDDAVDEVPYYSWLVRVPIERHRDRTEQAIPVVVAALQAHLRTLIPKDVDDWRIHPDQHLSAQEEVGRLLRDIYADLLDPLEVALLGWRHDGAQDLEPQARCWWSHDDMFSGTYVMWLGKDPHDVAPFQPWLLLYAGLIVEDASWAGWQAPHLRGLSAHTPLLLVPRPQECQWLVTVTTGTFTTRSPGPVPSPTAVEASYRWTGRDSHHLARRVAGDLMALFPRADTTPG